ncbi:MAG: serine/threonine-protein kinase, partial [Acidobacteria bacterium]
MNPDRWGQIKRIYHSALELEPGRREEFLREACASDSSLLEEVTSLLAQDRSPDGLLQLPALKVVAQAIGEDKAPKALLAGRTLLHYRIEEKIGQGGMGEVYRARDTSLDRTVALKILPAAFVSDQDRMRRFVREAKAASALSHQNVATIFAVGQAEGIHFIAMEYVSGETLAEYSRKRKLEPAQIIDIAIQMADTLEEAQAKGVIHRDLKPTNVMVTARGQVKVLDFGLAKLARSAGEPGEISPSSLTESGLVIGTVAYMSPEQVLGRQLDHRTDIFSLGTILYELATGHSPFAGRTGTEIMDRILHSEPEAIARFNPRVSPELERIVRKCLEKDSELRYQHASDLYTDLKRLKRDTESGKPAPEVWKAERHPLWSVSLRLVVVGVAVVFLVAAGWYWLGGRGPIQPEAPLTAVPLTSYPGWEFTPSFSPDGNYVAFEWKPEGPGANFDLYIKQVGVEPPFRLTTDPADDISPAWSPDGRFIAFLR